MLNIDLEFIDFLVNPNEDYIKDDIQAIKKEYLRQSSFETLKNKFNNFNKAKPILLTTIDDLRYFLFQINSSLIEEVYYRFAKSFNIKIKNNIEGNNFIETILLDNDIDNIHEDENLIILRTQIRDYLINITETTTNEKDKSLAESSIKYLDKLLRYYDSIKKILEPKENLVKELTKKIKEKSEIILKSLIKQHSYLLSEEKRKILEENPNIDIRKILHKEKLFRMFFCTINDGEIEPISMGKLIHFKSNSEYSISERTEILKENGIDIEKENIDINDIDTILKKLNYTYISNGKTYKGLELLEKLEEDINTYNKLYKDVIEDYILTIKKDELHEIIKNLVIKTLKDSNTTNLNKYIDSITNGILNYIKYSKNTISGFTYTIKSNQDNIPEALKKLIEEIPFQTYVLFPLRSVKIKRNQLINSFYFTLSHELGHIYTPQNETSKDYELLNEIYNDYRSDKIVFNLLCNGHFQKKRIKFKKETNLYSQYTFFLIDLFEEYKNTFEEFADNDKIIKLIELMGYETFRDLLIDLIKLKKENIKNNETQEKYLNKSKLYLRKIKQKNMPINNRGYYNPYDVN